MTKEEAKNIIQKLVERFREHREEYHLPDYNETKTRRDFIDPFFKALGWDIDNEQGFAEAYREVIHEDKTRVHGKLKAPDYGFRMNGSDKRLFFVEAKKPSVPLKVNKESAYQIRRYGRSAYTPVSILTNFEEFVVYDCTKRPNHNDSASNARLKLINFEQYATEFDFIYDTFSREAVAKGRFDKFVQSDTHKKGTQTLDKDFVASLDEWRIYLAKSIVSSNKKINEEELNYAVQQTIDRLIFLRFCEDRAVEQYGQLQKAVQTKGSAYNHLIDLFKQADDKYNSGLFDFKKDTITPGLKIPDKIFEYIISELYYPKCEYEFSVMPVEILGNAYEQFLGKVIRITAGHSARIEQKPEVRKAGGVFYTPQYIVEYIVKNTVGKLIEGKSPKEIEKIKIVDPACGSGSFLLGAFHYLLNYHANWYIEKGHLNKKGNNNPLSPNGDLTTIEKKKILLNNIFGVDIDANAVEVTKLSLLLKCMDGETAASVKQQLSVFHERVLPDLDGNIKCGNSLIDTDFYDQFDFGEKKKVNPFNWTSTFPAVFKQGGFDVVIGNPPYLRMQGLQETQPFAIEYYKKKYAAAEAGNFDLYVLFDERGFNLLNETGILGFIQPHKFFQADFGQGIRNLLSKEKAIKEIVNFGSEQVFTDATTYTCLLFLSKKKQKEVKFSVVNNLKEFALNNYHAENYNSAQPEINTKWNFVSASKQNLFNKLFKQPKTLGDITRKIFVGLQTSSDKIYVLKIIKEKNNTIVAYSKVLEKEIEIEKGLVKPFLMGKDVKRYEPLAPQNIVIFPYQIIKGSAQLMSQEHIKDNYPLGWDYILKNKKELEGRESNKMKGANFYAYIYPKNLTEFEVEKICTPDIANSPQFTIDKSKELYHTTTVYSFVFKSDVKENEKYFLGVLNSSLLWHFLSTTGNILRGGFFRFKTEYLKPFPIKQIDFTNKSEKEKHDEIVKQVDSVFELKEQLMGEKVQNKIDQLQQHLNHSEEKINKLVYELYNLTKEEIKVIEQESD